MRRILSIALVAVLLVPASLPAQKKNDKPKIPERPKLESGADTNDALAYTAYGWRKEVSWKKALDAFYWAHKLQPDDVGILASLQSAYWMRQAPEWRWEYIQGAGYVVKSKEAKTIDSLRYELAIRNPMVYLRTPCYRIRGIEDHDSDWEAAAILFDYGCYKESAERYAKAIDRYPKVLGMRLDRAHALHRSSQYDASVVELQVVLDTLRARDQKQLARQYESRAILEFMVGMNYLRAGKLDEAREAFSRALTEDLSLYWVHARLAELAMSANDRRTAIAEYEQAVALKPEDGVLVHDLGVAFSSDGKFEEAEPHFRRAIEIEPYFSTAYYNLAVALDRQGKREEARAAYNAYLERAPKRETRMIVTTHSRLKALQEPAPSTPE